MIADWRLNYGATSAPLVVGNFVVSGTSGGDEGIRGFLAAFDQATGKEVWRLWTRPGARRAGIGNVEGQGHRSPVRVHMADGDLRQRARSPVLADGESLSGPRRRASVSETTCTRTPSSPFERRRGTLAVVLPVHAARSVGLGRPATAGARGHRLGRGSRASSCCTRIATASSTCSIGRMARCCWPSRSCRSSPGRGYRCGRPSDP